MTLTTAQLKRYRADGYAVGGRILDDNALVRLRAELDSIIGNLAPDRRPENMPSLHYDNRYLRDLFLSDSLIDVAAQIVGPDVALFTSYVISKRPDDGLAVDWHQDAAFFPIEPMDTFTLWLAVDDSDVENGCMRVIPGSHREEAVLLHKVDLDSGTTLPMSLDNLDLTDAKDVQLRAGEYSVHDPWILHGSNPNRSSRRRCGITLKYISTHAAIDRTFRSPSGFDWDGLRLYLARGNPGRHPYAN
jgi:ectoine hydroxylase-related dioxygenase (phytanoyl-CoA dioxygenase family)